MALCFNQDTLDAFVDWQNIHSCQKAFGGKPSGKKETWCSLLSNQINQFVGLVCD